MIRASRLSYSCGLSFSASDTCFSFSSSCTKRAIVTGAIDNLPWDPKGRLSMAPVTIARFVQELEKLKQVSDAEKLKPQEYDSRLARIIQELREKGIDADRAATTAALADAVKRGIITLPVQAHLQRRLGLT